MKNLKLTFGERLQLTNFLAQIDGPVGKTAPLTNVYLKARFSEEELKEVRVEQIPGSNPPAQTYRTPSPDFGAVTLEVENADAAALVEELKGNAKLRVVDWANWANVIVEQLK